MTAFHYDVRQQQLSATIARTIKFPAKRRQRVFSLPSIFIDRMSGPKFGAAGRFDFLSTSDIETFVPDNPFVENRAKIFTEHT